MTMEGATTTIAPTTHRHAVLRAVSWCASCLVAAALLALVSLKLQELSFAPAVLLPLGVGMLLGVVVVVLARWMRIAASGISCAAMAFACGLTSIASQDAIAYLMHRQGYADAIARQPGLALAESATHAFEPPDFLTFWRAQYARTEPWWLVDSAITTVACVLAATIASRNLSAFSREQN